MELDATDQENQRVDEITRFSKKLALAAVILAALPSLIGWLITPQGSLYFGIQTNLDDHMVYAAWMRQAMDGHFFFDNRFAVEPQAGLTVHLYFFLLGLIAKILTIPVTMFAARLGFTCLFVLVFTRLLIKLQIPVFAAKYILMLGCFGGGIGFLVWERFGQDIVNGPDLLKPVYGGKLPIDVWQPEAFVFPSMLTNGLFMVSLCLILWVFSCVVEAKDSWKPVGWGALAFGLLMNIHSYDTLLIGLVLVGFLVTQVAQRQASLSWVARVLCIVAGAIPGALWFLHVLNSDSVFQARAATLTYSPTFRQLLLGILPAVVLSVAAIWKSESRNRLWATIGTALFLLALVAATIPQTGNGFFFDGVGWSVTFAVGAAFLVLLSSKDQAWNLAWSWALVGLLAPYFPVLFQRKLAMGIIVPWSILAGIGLLALLKPLERSTRNLVATLTLFIACASSILWFQREIWFVRNDVGSTAVHSVTYPRDVGKIIQLLNDHPARKVVVAMPGVWNPVGPADFRTPLVSDLNPVFSGMAGAYSYAGHWSETPEYGRRRGLTTKLFLATTSPEERDAILATIKPTFVIAPNTETTPDILFGDQRMPLANLRGLGKVVYEGNQLLLIQVREKG
ncbi:MAG: hypothetical protein JSS66_01280 [Armatimonadetes bacterium]|nr:hypothetical protein [Armatimonadota bacterium]